MRSRCLGGRPARGLPTRASHFSNFWAEVGPVSQQRKAHASELPAERHEGRGRAHAACSQGKILVLLPVKSCAKRQRIRRTRKQNPFPQIIDLKIEVAVPQQCASRRNRPKASRLCQVDIVRNAAAVLLRVPQCGVTSMLDRCGDRFKQSCLVPARPGWGSQSVLRRPSAPRRGELEKDRTARPCLQRLKTTAKTPAVLGKRPANRTSETHHREAPPESRFRFSGDTVTV